jgi:PAS domain S-box-containing protein
MDLTLILENIPEAIIVIDEEGRVVYSNPSAFKVLGLRPESIVGQKIWEIEGLDSIKVQKFVQRLREGRFWKKREILEFKREGEVIYTSVYATPIDNGFLLAIRDINPLIQAQRRVEELNEILRLMNKMLRHDILNKLGVIRGFLEILLDSYDKEKVEKAIRTTDEVVKIVERMRELENTLVGSELRLVDVRKIAEEVAEEYRSKGVEVKISGEALVLADEALYSVFDNLLSNSVKHGESKRIEISIEKKGDISEITVRDFGKGIPEEIIGRLFTEGFSYGVKAGSGLGLYIVKKVIERYGGEVRVFNDDGAVFVLRLKSFWKA